ncbi:hypothetical protein EST38_g12528 [Candolleomyces aberdarensis]|uniref:Uncharacterized protein n=1 Tax=Candolleomyces aberdarensis TaxID=2316362 RepID=A0A4Q2D464_9AGAR|nr:hypothetical protein EST38_g12528 [Candolleomyces aberdarensis]
MDDLSEDELRSLALSSYGRIYELADRGTYFSPNSTRNVSLPERPSNLEADLFRRPGAMLKDLQRPLWYDLSYPYLPFIPVHPFFDDLMCAPLCRQLELEEDFVQGADGWWELPDDVVKEWGELERQTKCLIAWCESFKPQNHLSVRSPSDMGFQRRFKEVRHAVFFAQRSRDWFMVMFAHATWLLSQHNIFSRPDREDSRLWKHIVKYTDADFLRTFVNSTIIAVSPHVPRVGCFYDVLQHSTQPEFIANQLNHFLYYSIPVWIPWTSETAKIFQHKALKRFYPNSERTADFMAEKAQRLTSGSIERWRLMVAAKTPTSDQPAPSAKPWEPFFKQREMVHARHLKEETQRDCQSRLDRERHAKTSWSLTSEFYKWELDSVDHVRKRRLLSKDEIEDEMCGRPSPQTRFDPLFNEWDICTQFGDDGHIMLDDNSDVESDSGVPTSPGQYILSNITTTLPKVATINSPLSPPSSRERAEDVEHTNHLTGRMASRTPFLFGLDVAAPPPNCPPVLDLHQCSVYRAFGGSSQPNPLPDVPVNRYLSQIFLGVSQAQDPQCIPRFPKFDLSPLHPTLSNRIKQLVTHINGHYIIFTPAPSPLIVVYRPEAAIFCCRLPDTKYETMALALYKHGIRFKACVEARVPPAPLPSKYIYPVLPSLIPENTILGKAAYESYTLNRALYFVGHRRRRAALLCGGLISRIARDLIGDEGECERLVLDGPSASVFSSRHNLVLGLGGGSYLYDDALEEAEMDYILGAYFFIVGKKSSSRNHVRSWWPRSAISLKDTVGVYHWFWDDYNEEWYQTHHASLESDYRFPKARTTKEWKRDSRTQAPVRDFYRGYRLLCTEIINRAN